MLNREKVYKIGLTMMVLALINLIWCFLELLFYGEITHRIVDDIVLLMFIPFVWHSITVKVQIRKGNEYENI